MKKPDILIIGGGLAGCEAAWQLAKKGFPVTLAEMKPQRFSPAHHSECLAELVCSNSLKSELLAGASGLLKAEMRRFDSLVLSVAEACRVPAGAALAVDRDEFAKEMTRRIESLPGVTIKREEVLKIPTDRPVIVATGPLTSDGLTASIEELCGNRLAFFDAAAPIISAESINREIVFAAARYDKGEADYLNCPFDQAQYEAFYEALITAERAELHTFEKEQMRVYEGCMPVEVMAKRGKDTLRFGPLRPVGLRDPRTGHRPWACCQLRAENKECTAYNLVGFQTNLKFGEQKRVFSMIPGLEQAEFLRYGVMHRNTFLDGPRLLNADFSLRTNPLIRFAGQMTGVEGYMESAASGLMAGLQLARFLEEKAPFVFPQETIMGALCRHISASESADYQPMGAAMGMLPPLTERIKGKRERYAVLAQRSLDALEKAIEQEMPL